MPVGLTPVDDDPAVLRIDLEVDGPVWRAPVLEPRSPDALENRVELGPIHPEAEVQLLKRLRGLVEVEGEPVVRKYLGAEVGDAYVDNTRPNGTNEIVVRIRPERWYSRDFGRPG